MLGALIGKLTGGIWKYLLIIGGVLLVIAKAVSVGVSLQRGKQAQKDLENVQNRNEALEEVNSLGDDAVDDQLREHIRIRDNKRMSPGSGDNP